MNKISIVIPFFNEEKRIHRFLTGLKNYQNRNQLVQQLILVNDGSTDNTLAILNNIKHDSIHIKVIDIKENRGKGNAVKNGILNSDCEWVLCNDADLSYSFEQIDEWYEKKIINLNTSNTVYFGKRVLNDKESNFHLHRIVIGKAFYLLIKIILNIKISDTQCGFKLYKSEIAKKVFKDLKEERFAFDIEVIYRLKKIDCNIQLNPVKCNDVDGSKVNLLTDSLNMFMALFRIRRY